MKGRTKIDVEKQMNAEKVFVLISALEVIANGDPIGVGLDEITDVAQNALDFFDYDDLM